MSKKNCVAKISLPTCEAFLYKNNCSFNSYKFIDKFAFIPYLSLCRNQKQESNIQQVGVLLTKNNFVFFIVSHALLQRYAKFNRYS